MKILFFGVFEKPYDTEVYILKSLQKLGHEVNAQAINRCTLSDVQELLKGEYDFILFSKGWFAKDENKINDEFRKSPILKVGWFFDLTIGTRRENQLKMHQSFLADIVLTTDGGHEEEFKQAGINHICLRQGIFEDEAYFGKPDKEKFKEDIVFVGTSQHDIWFKWTYRNKWLKWLQETYKERFGWYGAEDGIRNDELNNLYATAKIVVGDSVYHPHYWSNRLYETLGRGGFLIFPMIPGIEKEFIPYKHFIPYTIGDFDGLQEKIDYYLTHDKERKAIQKAGLEHCKKHHTYTHRCQKLIEIVNEHNSK
jgi:spore maturation protein CgeB